MQIFKNLTEYCQEKNSKFLATICYSTILSRLNFKAFSTSGPTTEAPTTVTFEMTFPPGVTESDFDAIKSALATVLGVNPSDITLSLKTTMKRQSVTTTTSPATIVVATVMGTKETASGIEMKIEEMTFVADVNNKLPSGPTLNSVSDPVVGK